MKKENINIVKEVAESLGIDAIHIQCDNSNFFAEGNIERNGIIFDDANEMAWGIRINNNNYPNSKYRATAFDYDTIQFITLELTQDKLKEFIELLGGVDTEELEKRFAKSPYDRIGDYKPHPINTTNKDS